MRKGPPLPAPEPEAERSHQPSKRFHRFGGGTQNFGSSNIQRWITGLALVVVLVIAYMRFIWVPDFSFSDRRYELLSFLQEEAGFSIERQTRKGHQTLNVEFGDPLYQSVRETLDCTVKTYKNFRQVRRKRRGTAKIVVRQEREVVFILYLPCFVEVKRDDGEYELCKADKFVYEDVKELFKEINQND